MTNRERTLEAAIRKAIALSKEGTPPDAILEIVPVLEAAIAPRSAGEILAAAICDFAVASFHATGEVPIEVLVGPKSYDAIRSLGQLSDNDEEASIYVGMGETVRVRKWP